MDKNMIQLIINACVIVVSFELGRRWGANEAKKKFMEILDRTMKKKNIK